MDVFMTIAVAAVSIVVTAVIAVVVALKLARTKDPSCAIRQFRAFGVELEPQPPRPAEAQLEPLLH